jgi:SecD/SecF fusion protein
MEKQKRWQFYLILAVLILTLYNILPTIFYYTKPLKEPINASMAEKIATSIIDRVDSLEGDSRAWLQSFSKLLKIHPVSIELKENDPRLFVVTFSKAEEAALFKRFLTQAGALIPFAPAQLSLYHTVPEDQATKVYVSRQVDVHLDPNEAKQLFQFSPKYAEDGQIASLYREVVYDRVTQLALAFGGPSRMAMQLEAIVKNPVDSQYDDLILTLAKEIVDVETIFGKEAGIAKRYGASLSQSNTPEREALIQKFLARMETLKLRLVAQKEALVKEQKKAKDQGLPFEFSQEQMISLLERQRNTLEVANDIIRKNLSNFSASQKPLTQAEIRDLLVKSAQNVNPRERLQIVNLEGRNPYIEALVIDWANDKIILRFYDDVQAIRLSEDQTEVAAYQRDKLNQLVINNIAHASQLADETMGPSDDSFAVNLNTLTNSTGFLTLNLGYIAEKEIRHLKNQLINAWVPRSPDLVQEVYPINDYASYQKLKPEEQKLGLVIYAPSMYSETPPEGFRMGSIYVIARGLDSIIQKYQQTPNAENSKTLVADINQLQSLLQQRGFIGYSGSEFGMAPEFSKDMIFELDDYYSNLIKATREDFVVKGSKRYAVLDFTDVEQRILTTNKIGDRIQEDLLKWKEEYNAAQVDINATSKYLVPVPTKNVYWENFKLSFAKYFRGDDRKTLKWGLDLSGGKTVRIGLRDHNNRVVTNPDDLKQAVNELYTRINKMGVSERTVRIEGNNIILDFPGSQNLTAKELVKASAMYFHIVNEKFTPGNATLKDAVNQFLQNVWNEAVVTNRKDIESINEIAWQHLGGERAEGQETRPRNEYAKLLWDHGLRLANPREKTVSSSFNDTLSAVAMMRGNDFVEWDGQPYPLLFIFHNYALEGSSLNNIQVGYDPTEGNILSFGVKRSYEGTQERGSGSPRDDFYAWTSQFAEDRITGTPKEAYTNGRGWRMAVILNDVIISKPTLRAALRDGGTISGRFSQREINQLASDLKAGSLSFTPKILSEQNVSPELGHEERIQGIIASLVAVSLVVIAMVGYYHFAGVVASCAVLLNILIMWGVLQNLESALTLPAIAGIVLTIGMAVDANVLVFERVREEFKVSGRIASAIQAGYRKAFSAIVDSNITTIIAALILIQFDSGPIKGFAVTLIIGILSSMFTALFMTRYFFAGWVQNPKHKKLTMSQFIGETHFDFLAQTKKAVIISVVIMVVGMFLFLSQRNTMLGMDFTGGYSLIVDLEEKPGSPNYRAETAEALLAHGATSNDFQIRELSRPNQLRIQMGISMEEKGHPFYQLPESTEGKYTFDYQHNPRLVWLVQALHDANLNIQKSQLANLDKNWTVMSGQLSDTMRNNAIIALSIALLSVLLYITFRFEFKYAIGAVVGLVHDVIITIGILAFFHKLGFPVQIDLQVIGAIMTIIGYSLNDTIIVFDRIREDIKVLRKLPFHDIVNHALNVTLSRTIMTSGTTMLVLLALVFLGGKSIFAFSLVMTIGVVVGTLSSLFIASPVMIYFHNREIRKHEEDIALKKA